MVLEVAGQVGQPPGGLHVRLVGVVDGEQYRRTGGQFVEQRVQIVINLS